MIESSKVKSTKRNIKQTYNGPPEIPHIIGVEPDQKNNERFIFKTFNLLLQTGVVTMPFIYNEFIFMMQEISNFLLYC